MHKSENSAKGETVKGLPFVISVKDFLLEHLIINIIIHKQYMTVRKRIVSVTWHLVQSLWLVALDMETADWLIPSQPVICIGMIWNTAIMTQALSVNKWHQIQCKLFTTSLLAMFTNQQWKRLLRSLNYTARLIPRGLI